MSVKALPFEPTPSQDRLIRLPEVEFIAGIKKSTIYELMRKPVSDGGFPRPVRLAGRTVAWSGKAVQSWVQDRITESQSAAQEAAL